jgi:hypothetical protein
MSTLGLIEYKDASPEVRAVYDDIMATRKTDWINNFWKAIAHDPATLKRTWRVGSADERVDLRRGERDEPVPLLYCLPHGFGPEEGNERRHVQGANRDRGHGERD